MSGFADVERVRRALADCFGEFGRMEQLLRAELSQAADAATPTPELLERRTRRFLVDKILKALGWDPADPATVREEARAFTSSANSLFFDYLGLCGGASAPVLIVEAKGADVSPPRPKGAGVLCPRETARHLAKEISIVKGEGGTSRSTAEWRQYLADLRTYVQSLSPAGRATLRRVVITTGKWLLVFKDPNAAFADSGMPDEQQIIFFPDVEEMQSDVERLYLLLHRRCLVDDMQLTVSVADALQWMRGEHVTGYVRATLVATTRSGAKRRPYPTRSIYPALAIETGRRWFVVVDYDGSAIEERSDRDSIASLLQALQVKGAVLEQRMRNVIGTASVPRPLSSFAGLPESAAQMLGRAGIAAEPDSIAATAAGEAPQPRLVAGSGELGADSEYVIVTGESWFYKLEEPAGPDCAYHLWRSAKEGGVTADHAPMSYMHDSFTRDAQLRHCAHGDHRAARKRICHLEVVETHLCCRACLFELRCWEGPSPLPCPTVSGVVVPTPAVAR